MGGEQFFITVVHLGGLAVIGQVHRPHKAAEALLEQPGFGDLAFGEGVPQLAVDGVVHFTRAGVVGQLVLGQHIGQGLALGGVKVQQCVVNVQQDACVNGHFGMTLLFLLLAVGLGIRARLR